MKHFFFYSTWATWKGVDGSGVELLPGSGSRLVSTRVHRFRTWNFILFPFFFSILDSYLRGLNRPFQVQSSVPSFQVLIGISFPHHLFSDGFHRPFCKLDGIVGTRLVKNSRHQFIIYFRIGFVLRIKGFEPFFGII